VLSLQRLRLDHGPALLAFEQENRAYFAKSIPDRGDDYFANFDARHGDLLAEQATGLCHFHVLVDSNGEVHGRFNLVDVTDGSAELGFRVAQKAAGQGVCTMAVQQLCALAAAEYHLTSLRAAATIGNLGSRAVLAKTGFVPTGELVELNGRPGIRFTRSLP
jgi:ribosomal-protein-alanine N-acetyltransferase